MRLRMACNARAVSCTHGLPPRPVDAPPARAHAAGARLANNGQLAQKRAVALLFDVEGPPAQPLRSPPIIACRAVARGWSAHAPTAGATRSAGAAGQRSTVAPMAAEGRACGMSAAQAAPTTCTATQRAAAAAACWSALPPPQVDAPRAPRGSHASARLAAALRAPPTQLAACSAAEPRAVWKARPYCGRSASAPPPLVARPAPRPLPRPTLTRARRGRRAS